MNFSLDLSIKYFNLALEHEILTNNKINLTRHQKVSFRYLYSQILLDVTIYKSLHLDKVQLNGNSAASFAQLIWHIGIKILKFAA